MKKLYFLLSFLMVTVASFGQLLTEPFDYAASTTNGITAQSSSLWSVLNTGADSILVTPGSLSYPGLTASTGNKVSFDGQGVDAFRRLPTNQTSTVYASFLLNVSGLGTLSTAGGYFFGLTEGGGNTVIGASVWTRLSGTGYNIGVNSRTTAANTAWLPTVLNLNTTYLVVIAYNIAPGTGDDFATIWLNPTTLGGAAPTPDGTAVATGTDLANVGRVQLRQPGSASEAPFLNIDELRIGNDFASVTPSGAGSPALFSTTLPSFGNVCINTTSTANSFTLSGTSLTNADVVVGPLAGYAFSTTAAGAYTPTLTLTQAGGTFSQTVFVQLTPTAAQSYNGNIPVTGGGATATTVAVTGTGVSTSAPTVATAASSGTTSSGITLNGTLSSTGCSTITSYGFKYSTTTGFDPATAGTVVTSSNLSGTSFSAAVTGLAPSTTYYYVAYATNGVGTTYSTQAQFTTQALPLPAAPVATAATAVTGNGFTANWNAVPGATNYFLDVYTQGPGTVVGGTLAGFTIPTADAAGRKANLGTAANVGVSELVAVNGQGTVSYTYPTAPTSSQSTFTASASGWDAGVDTKYWTIDVNTVGASNITVSSLQVSSNTGPKDFKIQYRVGNSGTWIDVPGGAVSIATSTSVSPVQYYGPTNLALPAAASNEPLVQIRWVVSSTIAVNGTTVASGGTSRITNVFVRGDYAGTVNTYVTGYQNQSTGNVTTYNVTGLQPNTNYYYVVRAQDAGGISANSNEISVTTTASSPALSAGTLADFGNVCANAVGGPSSFTVTGSNLTGDVTVGPLAGYTFSTSMNGTYSNTLTLTPTAGAINQAVFVEFRPTAAQSYNGNIAVSGGGATAINVAATGTGLNTPPTVTTGAASAVTTSGATLAGSITAQGCSPVTAYGIIYSTTSGFDPANSGIYVTGTNLSGTNFSVTVSGLAANTTYYYVASAMNSNDTAFGIQQSFTTSLNPSLSTTALTAFGDVCVNTTSGANSFTISGSNLTAADITVGPLAGYTFSTTANGTYTNSLTLTQAGGSYSQQVFVKFSPVAAQPYSGNIPVNGGGIATAVNVAASGAGINTTATVTAGAATGITATAATVPGSITAAGCSNATAYGVIYSTTTGFNPATTGTNVPGANLAGGNFTVNLSGLTPATTYYYVTYATNGGGTTYSAQQSFTTLTPSFSATALTAFGNNCVNTTSTANAFTLTGTNLVAGDITVGPLAGYTFSTTAGGTYSNSLTLSQAGGAYSQQVFVKFTPTTATAYNGNIAISGAGATAINVAASGTGVNTAPTVTAGTATAITATGATIPGTLTTGCAPVTAAGVIYSTTSGFNPASAGTTVVATSTSGANFSTDLTGLTAGTTYYYVTYATTANGTVYSTQGSFVTTSTATLPVAPVATAATTVGATGFTANWNAVTGATGYRLDVYTMGTGSGTSTIAGWDMPVNTAAAAIANQGNANNINIQTLSANTGAALTFPSGYSGTSGTPNPYAVSSNTWNGGANTKAWQIDVNTTGATNLSLSFNQGGSGTGPRDWKVQYRTSAAGSWNDVPNGTVTIPAAVTVPGTPATWAVVTNLPLPADAENKAQLSIRWLMTSETSVTGAAVAQTGTSRMSGIYVKAAGGGAPTPVYVTGYQDLSVGNVTSYNVTGLTPNTAYYYVVRATNAAGTSPNSNEIAVITTVAPVLSATALTAFGNLCPNTTSSANSFTINGSNLAAGNVTVGPLAGFAFSTTAAGTYTPTLTIPATAGTFSQQVFVQFTPTAVQSYSGNIPVSGAGASAINVAASGAGANNAPAVTTGAASNITNLSATLGGSITATGCTAVTAYGIEWSTTNGFANGTGTQVAGSTLAGGAFTANLSGLTASTIYYYKAFATNGGGTTYGAQQSFTTAAGPVISLTATSLTSFGSVCVGTTSAPASFTITGTNLTSTPVTVGPLAGFTFSTTAAGIYTPSLSLVPSGTTFSQQVFVRFAPTAVQSYNGNIAVAGGGAPATINVFTDASGKVQGPGVTTLDSTSINFDRVTIGGRIDSIGCSAVTEYGIEWSGIANFPGGTGTRVPSTNLVGTTTFSSELTGLVPGTTYYYRAYARNAGTYGYGAVKSITLPALLSGLRVYPVPATGGQELRVTLSNVTPGYHGIRVFNSIGDEVYRKDLNIQSNYINDRFVLPASLASGVYFVRVVSNTSVDATTSIFVR